MTGLAQEAQIGPVDVRGVGLKDVVGKENVRDFVFGDVGLHVFGEVARVDDVNLGEGVEEVAGEGVAEAVFEMMSRRLPGVEVRMTAKRVSPPMKVQ